jgi:hydroxyacylglutathione hydrolase
VSYTHLEDEFGDVVGKARRGQERSVAQVAADAGLRPDVIVGIEAYEPPPDEAAVDALAAALGLDAARLRVAARAGYFPADPHSEGPRGPGLEVRMLVLGTDFLMNGYIAICRRTRQAAVIDPGFQAARILAAVEEAEASVGAIWLTHGHGDHVGEVEAIVEATGAEAAIHADDLSLAGEAGRRIGQRLVPGGQVRVGEQVFEVRGTGGHTPGGVSLVHDDGVAFVGDALFAGSLGGTRSRAAYDGQRRAVQQLLLSLPPETVLYPGHGPATTVAEERANNPFTA